MKNKITQKDVKLVTRTVFGKKVSLEFGKTAYNAAPSIRISGKNFQIEITGSRFSGYDNIVEQVIALGKCIGDEISKELRNAQ